MTPEQILSRYGITSPDEIDIEAICQALHATVVYERLDGCEARVIGHGRRAYISVQPSGSRGRERFGAAHELGHWLHDRCHVLACKLDAMAEWGKGREMRANRFAQDLLMPREMFSSVSSQHLPTKESIRDLAHTFDVSMTAAAIRMAEHGPAPAVVACYSRNKLLWHKRSDTVPSDLWLSPTPPRKSRVADILEGRPFDEDDGPEASPSDEWFKHPSASDYEVYADCFVAAPDRVITLISWGEDESQLLEFLED